jgi:hypothetical protein
VVLTTVNHRNRDVWTLTLADDKGRQEQVRPTGSHKFYSVSRKAWVSAKDLELGEELRDVSGCRLTVCDRTRLRGTHTVYNMTVEGEHVYHVSPLGTLVHNDGCLDGATKDIRISSRIGEHSGLVREAEAAAKSHQASIDALTAQLAKGNMQPGIGSKNVFGNIFEARTRDGARVYFRKLPGEIQVLGKSTKANQSRVISILQSMYGK